MTNKSEHIKCQEISMENNLHRQTIYNEKYILNKTLNAWEYYFEQVSKNSIKDVYKSNKVIITDNKFYKKFKHTITKNNLNQIAKT